MAAPADPAGTTRCARCTSTFVCGMLAGETRCWCATLPPLPPVPGQACLCRRCLDEALRGAQRQP